MTIYIEYYDRDEPRGWYGFGLRMLVLMMVCGIIIGGIFASHGNPVGVFFLVCGIISACVWIERVTRNT